MVKYNKILVAVDGSESSLHALKESFKLTKNGIVVVSAAPPYAGDLRLVGVRNVEALKREPCETALARAQEMAAAAGASIKAVCALGEPHERIVDLAEGEDCDLIVMGVKGQSFLERILIGSVTGRVIGYSQKDVLVVPPRAAIGWGRMLLAVDGSPSSGRAAQRAFALAKAYRGKLKVVTVLDLPPEFYGAGPKGAADLPIEAQGMAGVKAQAESLGLKAEILVREGTPYKVITDLARKEKINLIILGSHGKTGLKKLLMGSVTERVIGHAPCPVLVVKG
jgi:nucleotide-binding universal stress UspA family protein